MDVLWVAFEGPQRGAAYLGMSGPHGRVMRRSFRTHRFVAGHTQGFTLGWYVAPRWGFQHAERTDSLRGVPRVLPWLVCCAPLGLSTRRTHRFVAV